MMRHEQTADLMGAGAVETTRGGSGWYQRRNMRIEALIKANCVRWRNAHAAAERDDEAAAVAESDEARRLAAEIEGLISDVLLGR